MLSKWSAHHIQKGFHRVTDATAILDVTICLEGVGLHLYIAVDPIDQVSSPLLSGFHFRKTSNF